MKKTSSIIPVTVITAALAAVIFRTFQLLVVVDYNEMGFFDLNAGFFLCYGLYFLFGLAAVLFVIGAILDKKKSSEAFSCNANCLTPKQTLALGVSFLVAALLKLYDLIFSFDGLNLDCIGEMIIFAAFAFIGFMLLSKKTVRPSTGYLQLLLSISFTIKSAALFMQDTIIVRVSDELILLLSYVMSVLFFLAQGRFLSSNESKRTRSKLIVCGSAAAVISLAASLPAYIAYMIDSKYMSEHMSIHPLSQMGVAVIAFTLLIILYSRNKLSASHQPENESDNENKTTQIPQI